MSEHPRPPYGPGPYPHAQDHPQATTVLVVGLLSLAVCQVLGPVAWVMGNSAVREIDGSRGTLRGRDAANIGRICGIIATALMVVALLLVVGVLAFGAALSFGVLAVGS